MKSDRSQTVRLVVVRFIAESSTRRNQACIMKSVHVVAADPGEAQQRRERSPRKMASHRTKRTKKVKWRRIAWKERTLRPWEINRSNAYRNLVATRKSMSARHPSIQTSRVRASRHGEAIRCQTAAQPVKKQAPIAHKRRPISTPFKGVFNKITEVECTWEGNWDGFNGLCVWRNCLSR